MRRLHLVSIALAGCGASYQSRYESDIHFAHCYRLDADRFASVSERLGCWNTWRSAYASNEVADRVRYAETRVAELARGDTSLRAPEPRVASPAQSASAKLQATDSPELSDSQLCARDCGMQFTACVTACAEPPCLQRCGHAVKACLAVCL